MREPAVREASWSADEDAIRAVRTAVFIEEQGIPAALEWDTADPVSLHVIAFDAGNRPIGTGRLLPDGHIGRMAVVKQARGRGVGSALMRALLAAARRKGFHEVRLSAQVAVKVFYERHGFRAEGEIYDEVGIPHVHMRRDLG